MIAGNDVVDRRLAGAPSPELIARILAPAERALVARAVDPISAVWRLWAAKEAAYKILARSDPELPFAHRAFLVDLDKAQVAHVRARVPVRWAEHGDALSCWGWLGDGAIACRTTTIEEAEATDLPLSPREAAGDRASRAARLCAKWLASAFLGVDASALEVVRPNGGAPELWSAGARVVGVTVSLAHDGRFVSCAVGRARRG